jgi:oligopeptide/dipeptide ABC transporter ATP-binding protein
LEPLLRIRSLTTEFRSARSGGYVRVIDGVSFDLHPKERVAIVGESGSGKSVTVRSILGLVPEPGRVTGGEVLFKGRNLLALRDRELARIRGKEIALIFQDPLTSWNPVKRVGAQIDEAQALHGVAGARARRKRTVELLSRVGIPSPRERAEAYPHQFSGGMRQRGMIAMGLANDPDLLIADEPTTALDVTVQDQIIRRLRDLSETWGSAILLITHNLALVSSLSDRVVVMYAGRVLEQGTTDELFCNPQHPYTWGLLRSVPRLTQSRESRLTGIPGNPPQAGKLGPGCKFCPRCTFRIDRCATEEPPMERISDTQSVRCWVKMGPTRRKDA